MRKLLALLLLLATPVLAGDLENLRDTEIAFAKAFTDRDQAKFFSFVLDDATFLGGLNTLHGKPEVVARWSRFFKAPAAPFNWTPERIAVNAAGNIGLSTGPVVDPKGSIIGIYASVWLKQTDGSWKILFDGPGESPACLADNAAPIKEGDIALSDGAKLHYKTFGDGPIKLIVPLGFILEEDFKQLGDLATLYFYDPRNRGRSSHAEDVNTLTIQQDVKDLEAVREFFKIDKFVPVGFSYAGLMVAMYTAEHPEHVSRVIQLGPVPRKYPSGIELPPAPDTSKYKSQREACEAFEAEMKTMLVGNPANAPRVRSLCMYENEWPANQSRHLQHHFGSVLTLDWPASNLAKITMPVLVIHGTKDRNAPYESGREWASTLPDARLVTIRDGAHESWIDDPVDVFGSIRQFLRNEWPLMAEKLH